MGNGNDVPDWVHDRFQRIEDVQRDISQQISHTNQQLAINTTTVKAFGEQMKTVVDIFLEKLELAEENTIANIQIVKEEHKNLSQRMNKSDEEIKQLKTGEHRRTEWVDWVRKLVQQIIVIVLTAWAALTFGGHK